MEQKKSYTSKQQRELLESVGIPHVRGRTFEEAQELISEQVRQGRLRPSALSPATEKQVAFLKGKGITVDEDLTKEKASELIESWIARESRGRGMTPRQKEFITELGGSPSGLLNSHEASRYIDYLLENQSQCPNCGANNDRRHSRCPYCGGFLATESILHPPFSVFTTFSWIKWLLSRAGF